ncbi:hypothetical protein jhhlp_005420 [Lomentospora prolificans]|uniref:Rhodopsin domain-containing protein n=1 Tax=Lomentospora prolificans TaxID=41688 RepID=A0A2N3N6W1_9PEZI|nr:hypothetical protein jhhlp_005420 [Lomentospora prolificans]
MDTSGLDMTATDDLSQLVIACAIVCLVVSGLIVGLRFYSRGVITKVLGREDWCILVAWASYINVLFYQLSLAMAKISILFLYIRVLTYDYARRAAYAVLAIVVIYNILGFISTMTLCRPLRAYWDLSIHEKKCHPPSLMWVAIGLHIGTDFLIFLIPMPVILRMSLPWGQKIGLFVVFALGFFVCLISILRAIWIHELIDSQDSSYDFTAIKNWTSVEINVSIAIPCLVVFKPLLNKIWPKIFGSTPSRNNQVYNLREHPVTIGSDPSHPNRGPESAHEAGYAVIPSAKSSFITEDQGNSEMKNVGNNAV